MPVYVGAIEISFYSILRPQVTSALIHTTSTATNWLQLHRYVIRNASGTIKKVKVKTKKIKTEVAINRGLTRVARH